MDFLRRASLLFVLTAFSGCAKIGYLFEQGIGQLNLLYNGVKNEKVLKDPKYSKEVKNKIKEIETLKSHFYKYWEKEPTDIYSETVFLKGDAVTWLVIASRYNEIKALKHCFPFYGCFPYIGFFKKSSASEFLKELEEDEYQTYIRPVKAYSTLGNFDDAILSTFFDFSRDRLTELIFHELFHTIFFVEDEVDLNESLANLISQKMAHEYLRLSGQEVKKRFEMEQKFGLLRKRIIELGSDLQALYDKNKGSNGAGPGKQESEKILEVFLENTFRPEMKKLCNDQEIKIENCYPLKRKWNNASFAALGTYEAKRNLFDKLLEKHNGDLRSMFRYIQQKHEQYEQDSPDLSFESYLFGA